MVPSVAVLVVLVVCLLLSCARPLLWLVLTVLRPSRSWVLLPKGSVGRQTLADGEYGPADGGDEWGLWDEFDRTEP